MRMSRKSNDWRGLINTMQSEPVTAELSLRGERISSERRTDLRAKLKAGELEELVFDAIVYRDGPNGNHVRFRTNDLPAFAESFVGQPFLRNHDVGDVGSRDGTVVGSSLIGNTIHQRIRLTTQRGMRDFLDGV